MKRSARSSRVSVRSGSLLTSVLKQVFERQYNTMVSPQQKLRNSSRVLSWLKQKLINLFVDPNDTIATNTESFGPVIVFIDRLAQIVSRDLPSGSVDVPVLQMPIILAKTAALCREIIGNLIGKHVAKVKDYILDMLVNDEHVSVAKEIHAAVKVLQQWPDWWTFTGLNPDEGNKGLDFAKKEKMETKAEAKEQTQVVNKDQIKVDPKFLDEIENMYPMPEELIRDTTDPITFGLFSDERLAEIGFDSDFREAFMDNKDFDFDAFL